MIPERHGALHVVYGVVWCLPAPETLPLSCHSARVESAYPGERSASRTTRFDMASKSELAELIQLGQDMWVPTP